MVLAVIVCPFVVRNVMPVQASALPNARTEVAKSMNNTVFFIDE